jgi:hypothetical protein
MVGLIAVIFGYVEQDSQSQQTDRARIEAKARDSLAWAFKVVEMYFDKRELFDLTKNTDQASSNLRVLISAAPTTVQGVLNAEAARIPPPGGPNDSLRLRSLAAVAGVQNALSRSLAVRETSDTTSKPYDFTVYVQYPPGDRDLGERVGALLKGWGYAVPVIQKVNKTPSHLQVRYYRANQRPLALKLAVALEQQFNLPTDDSKASIVSSSRELPNGILEVWLPSH